ncbi:YitT family protein [Peribacillus psychrosaccharolyticus]|uniref:YitT family protein n=1 Tax=Peribacillus psychrosaccharolyticus TaxID=1407 RepID=UPI00031D9196|nr:YitT family protein [Peribacillus psychrosaccharolyticus]MEC2056368.1 YitT family protein [Peribacillus psychrosaccharolyticus]MED3743770.1 YitT family protein [Peribacillus psychrosaccharolyticus]
MSLIVQKLIAIIIGSFLVGSGINGFLVPYHLLDGGMIGLALILHYYFEVSAGICMFILSIPLCIFAWTEDRAYSYSSFLGLLISSAMIDWLRPLQTLFLVPIGLSSILGGMCMGLGIGLMLRFGTSTGGTDLLATYLSKMYSMNTALIIFLLDVIIVTAGSITLNIKSFLYSCLMILIAGLMTNLIKPAKI